MLNDQEGAGDSPKEQQSVAPVPSSPPVSAPQEKTGVFSPRQEAVMQRLQGQDTHLEARLKVGVGFAIVLDLLLLLDENRLPCFFALIFCKRPNLWCKRA